MVAFHLWLGNGLTQNVEQDSGDCVGQHEDDVISCLEHRCDTDSHDGSERDNDWGWASHC
jgi:hypothetical protein